MFNLLAFLIVLSILVIVHEFGHFMAAKKIGVRVEKFSLGFGRPFIRKKINDTEYSVSAILLGGYVKMAGDNLEEFKGNEFEFLAKPAGKRFWVIVFGPVLNYVLGFLFFSFLFFINPSVTTKVGDLTDGFGAQAAGIQVGDKITAVDGELVEYWEDLQRIISSKKDASMVRLSVLRENQEYTIDVNIKEDEIEDTLGKKHHVGRLGIKSSDDFVRHGLFGSLFLGAKRTWSLTTLTFQALGKMVTGKLSMRDSVTGFVGIYVITAKFASLGIMALMHLMAVLSISLAIFNLLPLPVLDGGHIFLLAVEKIRGKALSLKVERMVTQIGVTLLVSLALFVTYNDVLRFFGDKIAKIFK